MSKIGSNPTRDSSRVFHPHDSDATHHLEWQARSHDSLRPFQRPGTARDSGNQNIPTGCTVNWRCTKQMRRRRRRRHNNSSIHVFPKGEGARLISCLCLRLPLNDTLRLVD